MMLFAREAMAQASVITRFDATSGSTTGRNIMICKNNPFTLTFIPRVDVKYYFRLSESNGAWYNYTTVPSVASAGQIISIQPSFSVNTRIQVYYSTDGTDPNIESIYIVDLTVYDLPPVNTISIGQTTICQNSSTIATNTTPSGVWSSDDNTVATINASGNVNAIAEGFAYIYYTVTDVNGCVNKDKVGVTVNPTPTIQSISSTICSSSTFSKTFTTAGSDFVPPNTKYTWSAPTPVSGLAPLTLTSGTNSNNFSATVTNLTNAALSATYSVTPITGSCPGVPFNVNLLVTPKPFINAYNLPPVCNGSPFSYTPTNGGNGGDIVPANITYSWGMPTPVTGITGYTSGSSTASLTSFTGTLSNSTSLVKQIFYTVTTLSDGCAGSTFTLTVNVTATASIANITLSPICSGSSFNYIPNAGSNRIPSGTTYSWSAPSGITGTLSGTSLNSIGGTLTNTTSSYINVVYHVTPNSNGCDGTPFDVTIRVNPIPVINNLGPTQWGSANQFSFSMSGPVVPTGTTYSWPMPQMDPGIIGGAASQTLTQNTLNGTLTNTTQLPLNTVYTITPTYAGCPGNSFTYTLAIYPNPIVNDVTLTGCSGALVSKTFVDGQNQDIIPSGTVYDWGAPTVTNISGTATATGQSNFNATLTNTSLNYIDVTYVVTPKAGTQVGNPFNVVVRVHPLPTATIAVAENSGLTPNDNKICLGASATLTVQPSTYSPSDYTYTWTTYPSGTITNVSAGTFSATPSAVVVTGNYVVSIRNNITTCSNAASISTTVRVFATPTVGTISGTYSICIGSSAPLTATGGTSGTTPYTYNWQFPTNITGSATSTVTANNAMGISAGTSSVTYYVSDVNGCASPYSAPSSFMVFAIPVNPTVTPASYVYDGLAHNLIAAPDVTPPPFGTDVLKWYAASSGGVFTSTTPSITNQGTKIQFAETFNNTTGCTSAARVSETVNILAATLTVTANTYSKTYDAIAYASNASNNNQITFTGFVNNEIPTNVLSGTLTLTGTAQGAINAGTYSITASGFTANNLNYNIGYVNGVLTIDKRIITAVGAQAITKVYDGTASATYTYTSIGNIVAPDNNSNLVLTGIGSFPSKNVGTNLTVTTSSILSGVSSPNYTFTEPTGLTASITPKPIIEISAQTFSKTYDGTRVNVGYTSILRPTENIGTGTYTDGTAYTGDALTIVPSANFVAKDVTVSGAISSTSVLTGVDASNYSLTVATGLTPQAIIKKNLTMFGLNVVSPKIYDGTLASTVTNSPGLLQTPVPAGTGTTLDGKPYDVDVVTLSGTASGTYNTKDVATANSVTFSGISLTGAQAGNYSLTIQTPANATIIKKTLTFSGLSVPLTKVYDATTTAVVSPTGSSGTLQTSITAGTGTTTDGKWYTGDVISLTGTPTANYNTRFVATANTVSFTGVTLTGAQSGNYSLTAHTSQAATITPKPIAEINAQTYSKTYDGTLVNVGYSSTLRTTEAPGTGTTIDGIAYTIDNVGIRSSADFLIKDVTASGTITSTSLLTGTDAPNYTLTRASSLTPQAITKKNLTMYGLDVVSPKVYDGTTTATVTNSPGLLQTPEAGAVATSGDGKPYIGDVVSLTGPAIGTFNSKFVPSATTVTYSGVSLTGAQAGNYSLTIQTPANATITQKALTFSGLTVPSSKVYDATTNAVVSGTFSPSGVLQTSIAAGTGTATDGKPYTGDNVTLTGTPVGTYNSKNVLTANTVAFTNISIQGAQATSYSLTPHANQDASITVKPINEVNAITKEKIYDATLLDVGYTSALQTSIAAGTGSSTDGKPYSGDNITIQPSANFAVKDVITSGSISSTSTLSGTDSSNYSLTKATNLSSNNIIRKQLTMLGLSVAATKIYDGTTNVAVLGKATLQTAQAPGAGTVEDGKPYIGDVVNITGTPIGVYDFKDVPMASMVTYSNLNLAGSQSGNYTLKIQEPSIAKITNKKLNMQGLSVPDSKVYDGNTKATVLGTPSFLLAEDPGIGNTLDGKPYVGDVINIVGVPTATYNSKNVVDANKVSFTGLSIAGLVSYNYLLNIQSDYPAKIVPLNIKVNADEQTKIYGDDDPAFTYKNDSIIYGDQFTGNLSRATGQNVGAYEITKGTLDLGTNYTITYKPNNLIITEAPISLQPDTTYRIYGDAPIADGTLTSKFKIIGLKYNENVNSVKLYFPKGVGTGNDKKDSIGVYNDVVLAKYLAGGTAVSSNYKIVSFPGDIKITPLPILIKADTMQKRASEPDRPLRYLLSFPLINGDSVTGKLIRDTGEIPGTYLINQGTLELSKNYLVSYQPDYFTILTVENIFVVPNAFTPNGDNKNDYIKMLTTNVDHINYFKIFNRAGKLIYETQDLSDKWDGRVNGVLQDPDAYYWIAQYYTWDKKTITTKGSFILLK